MNNNRIKLYNEMMNPKSFIKTYTALVANAGAKEALVVGNLASMQKHYANKRKLDDEGYFFSTYKTIAANTGLTEKQVILAVKNLEDRKILFTKTKCIKASTTKSYRVNYRILNRYLTYDFDLIVIGSLISLQKYYEAKEKARKAKIAKDENHKEKAWLDKEGYFTCTMNQIINNSGLDDNKIIAIIKDLVDKKLVLFKINSEIVKDKKSGKEKKVIHYWYKVDIDKASDYLLNIPSKESENVIADDYEDEDGSTKGSFFMAKKKIAQKIDPISAIIFADIWASFNKAVDEGTLDEEEWFYIMQDKISSRLGISRKTICTKYIPILKKSGIIDVEVRGFQPKSYIRINFDVMDNILEVNTSLSGDDKYKALTKRLIAYAENISDIKWDFDYYKVGCISDVLNELHVTEEQLKQVIENRYIYYREKDALDKMFTFANVVGQPSKVAGWLKAVESTKEDAEIKAQATEVTEVICDAMNVYTNGEIEWTADSRKEEIIRKVLLWPEGFNEEDLIKHAKARYDWCKDNNKKMTAFYKLFSKDEKDNITNSKKQKQYKKSRNLNFGRKVDSQGRSCDKHGVSCTPIGKEGLEFQDKMRAAGEVY